MYPHSSSSCLAALVMILKRLGPSRTPPYQRDTTILTLLASVICSNFSSRAPAPDSPSSSKSCRPNVPNVGCRVLHATPNLRQYPTLVPTCHPYATACKHARMLSEGRHWAIRQVQDGQDALPAGRCPCQGRQCGRPSCCAWRAGACCLSAAWPSQPRPPPVIARAPGGPAKTGGIPCASVHCSRQDKNISIQHGEVIAPERWTFAP